jgi:hypothetical protein
VELVVRLRFRLLLRLFELLDLRAGRRVLFWPLSAMAC